MPCIIGPTYPRPSLGLRGLPHSFDGLPRVFFNGLATAAQLGGRARGLPSDDGEVGRAHAGPHEQHHVLVPRLPVGHHLPLEGLQLVLVVPLDVDEAYGHLAVPATMEHLAEAAFADQLSDLQLLEGDVPLLEEDAGLAGLAWEVASGEEGQVHLLEVILRLFGLVIPLLVLWGDKWVGLPERGQPASFSQPLCM